MARAEPPLRLREGLPARRAVGHRGRPSGRTPGGGAVWADASGGRSHRGREGEADMRGEGKGSAEDSLSGGRSPLTGPGGLSGRSASCGFAEGGTRAGGCPGRGSARGGHEGGGELVRRRRSRGSDAGSGKRRLLFRPSPFAAARLPFAPPSSLPSFCARSVCPPRPFPLLLCFHGSASLSPGLLFVRPSFRAAIPGENLVRPGFSAWRNPASL
jgi:hypothetical protein